jgi:hypothetical protein
MSDIFFSYDDQDRPRVEPIVAALEAQGLSVWWDHRIATGDSFAAVIERELDASSCVVVAWSHTSVRSDWVRAEADKAWKRQKLVPVLLDRVEPPMPFGQVQAANLVEWHEQGHEGFGKLLADLRQRIRKPAVPSQPVPSAPTARSWKTVAAAVIVLLAAGVVGWTWLRPASTGADGASAASDVTARGHWQAQVTYPDGAAFEERFFFEIDGRDLSGTASLRGYGNRRGILDGAIDGDRLSFRTKSQVQLDLFSVRDVTYVYRGVAAADAIRFTVSDEASGAAPFEFTARRITAEQADRIATGGTRPRISGMTTGDVYQPDHVRTVVARQQQALDACYAAAEFEPAPHEHAEYLLTVTAAGVVADLEMRPAVPTLEACVQRALAAADWGKTDSGQDGTVRISLSARLPWNP